VELGAVAREVQTLRLRWIGTLDQREMLAEDAEEHHYLACLPKPAGFEACHELLLAESAEAEHQKQARLARLAEANTRHGLGEHGDH